MGQRKGQTGNPNGRPKGKPNKLTSELREVLGTVLSKEVTPRKLSSLLRSLEPQQRINALAKLLEFTVPKLSSISFEKQIEMEYEQLERLLNVMPDEALDQIFERIKKLKDESETKKD